MRRWVKTVSTRCEGWFEDGHERGEFYRLFQRKVGFDFDRRSTVGVGSKFFGRFVVRGL